MTTPDELPELPPLLLTLRKIRGCESEIPAQLVLEQVLLQYGAACMRAGMEKAAGICENLNPSNKAVLTSVIEFDCAAAIRSALGNKGQWATPICALPEYQTEQREKNIRARELMDRLGDQQGKEG